jgi:hypothetical protein
LGPLHHLGPHIHVLVVEAVDELVVEGFVLHGGLVVGNAENLPQEVDCFQPGLDLIDLRIDTGAVFKERSLYTDNTYVRNSNPANKATCAISGV